MAEKYPDDGLSQEDPETGGVETHPEGSSANSDSLVRVTGFVPQSGNNNSTRHR